MHSKMQIAACEREMRAILADCKAITSVATKANRGLTEPEKLRVDGGLARVAELKEERDSLMAADAAGKAIRTSVGTGGTAWAPLAKALVAGERSVTLSGFDILSKAVSDADLATDDQTGRAVIERPGITGQLVDSRYIYGVFPRANAGNALAVSEFVETSEALGSGSAAIERDLLSTAEKAELDVTIEHVSMDLRQVAVLIRDIPNALLQAEGSLQAFLGSRMQVALNEAIDAHVLAAITAASPATSTGGSDVASSLRYGMADMAANGAKASVGVLTPEQAVEIDVALEIDMPQGFPFGLSLRESKSASSAMVIDPSVAGVLYLGSLQADVDPYSGFSENTTTLRLECSLLFVVRNKDGVQLVSSGS